MGGVANAADRKAKKAGAPCCEATVEAQKKCKNECCQKAATAGKICEKCHPTKDKKGGRKNK